MAMLIATLSFVAWVVVFTSAFLVDQSELFELHHVANRRVGRPLPAVAFRAPVLSSFLRQPIYPGIVIAVCAAPTMSVGHLLLAAAATAYIVIGIMLEDRDLIGAFGDD